MDQTTKNKTFSSEESINTIGSYTCDCTGTGYSPTMRVEWIKMMMQMTGASKEAATKALKNNDDDVTNAIKELRETK
jgi:hypothetical protein